MVRGFFPYCLKNQKKVQKLFPFFSKAKQFHFSQTNVKSGWIFFPKHPNQVIHHHKHFIRYGHKGIDTLVFDTQSTLLESLPLENTDFVLPSKIPFKSSCNLRVFVKTGLYVPALFNHTDETSSIKIHLQLYKYFIENLNIFSLYDKKNCYFKKSFLIQLRQTLYRHAQNIKLLTLNSSFSSFSTATEPIVFQFISNSKFRWKPTYQPQTKKNTFFFSTAIIKSSSYSMSENAKRCLIHLSRIHLLGSWISYWCVLDSPAIRNKNVTPLNQVFWFVGKFSKSSNIFLIRKPVEYSLEKLTFLQTQLSGFLRNPLPSRSKQYLSKIEQQIKLPKLGRLQVKLKEEITEAKKNKQKKLKILQFGQQLKNTTILPFYKPLSIDVRVKKFLSDKKNFKKYSKSQGTSKHTQKKYFSSFCHFSDSKRSSI